MQRTLSDCNLSHICSVHVHQQQEIDINGVTEEVPHQVPSTFR